MVGNDYPVTVSHSKKGGAKRPVERGERLVYSLSVPFLMVGNDYPVTVSHSKKGGAKRPVERGERRRDLLAHRRGLRDLRAAREFSPYFTIVKCYLVTVFHSKI
jgi:hypothetical protein